ncbi:A24 family peptidase [Paenibacillus kobensis]|uniref:A24 family peptidase n=1 Tax=Paenibacillus kobensis TaxID=59841 RepID=UPI000FDB6304|nr:prepilin peptidase [Paenibacillus kobensis]
MALWVALVIVVFASITDIRSMRIPNQLTAASFAVAIIAGLMLSGVQGVWYSLAGAAAGIVPMLIMYGLKGVGAGDVKLFAALGAWLGVHGVLGLMLYSILYAGAIGILLAGLARLFGWPGRLTAQGETVQKQRAGSARLRTVYQFPFMLAVAPAFITCWIYVF